MVYVENRRKELKKAYPHEKGLTAGTQKQTGRVMNLLPQGILGVKSHVTRRDRVGF